MIQTLRSYADSRNYELAAAYGVSPFAAHHYYVRKDFKDSEEIIRMIRNVTHKMKDGVCVDYGRFPVLKQK